MIYLVVASAFFVPIQQPKEPPRSRIGGDSINLNRPKYRNGRNKKNAEHKSHQFRSILNVPVKSMETSFLSFVAISLQKSPSIKNIPPISKAKRVEAVARKEEFSGPNIGF